MRRAPPLRERRAGGCGCVGWGIGAIVLLLLADGVLHIWFPLLFVLLLLIVAGMGFALLVGAIRSRGAVRGPFDPRNADWHPRALVEGAGPGRRRRPDGRPSRRQHRRTHRRPHHRPARPARPRPPAWSSPLPPTPAGPAPDAAEPGHDGRALAPEAPEAPEAPKAPDWA